MNLYGVKIPLASITFRTLIFNIFLLFVSQTGKSKNIIHKVKPILDHIPISDHNYALFPNES
jgi:hypothetical protein